jgi:hypothetical protein
MPIKEDDPDEVKGLLLLRESLDGRKWLESLSDSPQGHELLKRLEELKKTRDDEEAVRLEVEREREEENKRKNSKPEPTEDYGGIPEWDLD